METDGKPARSGFFGVFGRRRTVPPLLVELPPSHGYGVDENLPAGIRLAAAWSWRLLALAGALAVFIFIVIQLRLIVIPLLVAVLVSALLVPFVGFLVRHRFPKALAVVIALINTFAILGGLVTLAVTQIAIGTVGLNDRLAASYDSLKAVLLASPLQLTEPELNAFLGQAWDAIQADSQVFVSGALSVGSSLGHLVTGFLLALFSLLFILIDGKGIWSWIVRLFPQGARAAIDGAGVAGWTTLGNFARVQILVASIDAIGIGVGAALLGVPLAIPIGVLVFLGSFIPIVGAVATGAVAVVIALIFNDWVVALLMLGVVLLVQQVEGHVLQPLIMGTAVKVHPLGVVLVVAAGALLAGIAGALFAVPIAAVLNVMISYINSGAWRSEQVASAPVFASTLWQTVPQRPGFRRPAYRLEKSASHD
ncbi:AI-2E family transporter [Cryobacterium sp. TMT2-18-3]|uniref:AI-2E family transporter n=1 Tax=unclassified Cryobacterium TaxID=2649013 RepID=UPI00106DD27A|nr:MULTISPECIES: AI-2E family transporter [unclassified Cryobacterium]TFC31703.1 AI-2E family transporter [Cryobacterium sp. TMT2-18-2]TFC33600.1 AI-2E family transporter [Cryobacterium sp. TMT2-42-4]TFC61911.1 AI-2E family transporter [Cryobacterium sp. TMT2-15-1]TFC67732.1 AI-2E family transporter [Cryobacterium sp. TMT2-18-3]